MSRRTKSEIMEGIENVVSSKIVANNTVKYQTTDGRVVYRLHLTDIVTIHPDASIELNTDGWKTVTTKERINRYLCSPFHLYQENSVWYLSLGWNWSDPNRKVWMFKDHMRIIPTDTGWEVEGAGEDPKVLKQTQKRIKTFVSGYLKALMNRELDKPNGGDCWYCMMKETKTGRPLGDVTNNSSHILSHFDEKYYVPSILANAIEEIPVSQAVQHCVGYWWKMHEQRAEFWEDIAEDQIKRSMTRYLKRRLGMAA